MLDIAARFGEIIDDMLADDWSKATPRDAAELLQIVLAVKPKASLPVPLLELLARPHKRQRGRPKDSFIVAMVKWAIIDEARERWRELRAQGVAYVEAQEQAAEEAGARFQECGLGARSINTILRWID